MRLTSKKKKIASTLIICLLYGTLAFPQYSYMESVTSSDEHISPKNVIGQSHNTSIAKEGLNSGVFFYKFGMGYSFGQKYDYDTDLLKLTVLNGYRFNPFFSLGLGAGVRYYYDERDAILPIFTVFRVNLNDKKISPSVALTLGYVIDIKRDFRIDGGGLLTCLSTALNIKLSDITSLNIEVSYELQESRFMNDWLGTDHPNYLSSFGIDIGISFRHLKLLF